VLELGCGGGWCGLVAAELGARVIQTDYIPAALELARENAWRNGVTGIRRFVGDWRVWPLRARFPLVIGSDIAYERSVHAALQAVLEATVAPGGTVLLADPGRRMSLEFAARLETGGWNIALETLDSTLEAPLYLYRASPPE
jgi:predicted nicotinamide N-methyase